MSEDETNLGQVNLNPTSSNQEAGLAPLLLTVTELLRQLMEAQVIRRMDSGLLTDEELDRAGDSLQRLEEEIIRLCNVFEIDPKDLNIDLGELGSLMPKEEGYYPGQQSQDPSILELLDRLLHTGVVINGNLDLGIAELSLIQAQLQLVLTSKPINHQ